MQDIKMVDLRGQYLAIKSEIDEAIQSVLDQTAFIKGPPVKAFETDLAAYVGCEGALAVGNGTDALQIAFMALGIGAGDEVITPAFTFIATAEAAALMGAKPVFVDIDPETFNMDPTKIEALITPNTKAIVPVHLFGQSADLDPILAIAKKHGLYVIEDCAQAIGATYKGRNVGTDGHFGTLSCFPSKNLGAYGDAGAMYSNDADLLHKARMIANHGSQKKYYNELVGINSRLDTIQAAILGVKLRYLDDYIAARQLAAKRYDQLFDAHDDIKTPAIAQTNEHVYHQYTLRVQRRDELSTYLKSKNIPHAVYYPVSLHQLPVFESNKASRAGDLTETMQACKEVISLPMHTELTQEQQTYIAENIIAFSKKQPVSV
ncbi:MAG: DegT/DnrJ/EryC1/StrS family aminotransferase [Rhodothermales bacterium]